MGAETPSKLKLAVWFGHGAMYPLHKKQATQEIAYEQQKVIGYMVVIVLYRNDMLKSHSKQEEVKVLGLFYIKL